MLQVALALCLFPVSQTITAPAAVDSATRRAAVERLLTPTPWVEGQEFLLLERMRDLNIPGASIAVIHEGRLDWAAGYGLCAAGATDRVTTQTLFQAASISKSVSALATVLLAQQEQMSLDAPINALLTSWTLPQDNFEGEVTPRHLLSHTGGIGVHGFPGYATFDPLATTHQVLDGAGPANTNAIRRVEPLGNGVRYSGGGSTILQVALQDVTGMEFADLMQTSILGPLAMAHSTYAQPLSIERWPNHSQGHDWGGWTIPGGFHVYPEQFPAGLWTTPSDLTRFVLDIQAALAGSEEQLLTTAWAQQVLTPERENSALGFFIEGQGDDLWFSHGGSNEGFKCLFRASQRDGRGVVVMTNGDQGSILCEEIVRAVARVYGWPDLVDPPLAGQALEPIDLQPYVGHYTSGPDEITVVSLEKGCLVLRRPPERPYRLASLGDHEFLALGTAGRVIFSEIRADGAALLTTQALPILRSRRMDEYEHWPLVDLLKGDIEEGLEFYRDLHGGNPDDALVARDRLHDLASHLWSYGHAKAGLELAQLLLELYPEDADAWDTLGRFLAAQGQSQAAREAYQACLDNLADDPRLDAAGRAWLRTNATSKLRGLAH